MLKLEIKDKKRPPIETFAHILDDMIELQDIGILVNYNLATEGMELHGIYNFNNPQLATMGIGIEELNQQLATGEISREEYGQNIEPLRKIFNAPIKDYIY
ncbi:hypothetical protein [Zhenpiania hominis]|uniref:hypothetical protein n=1 Tax=Zhenpiania hominis TaxID=2763644 RepID=UPI0039F59659